MRALLLAGCYAIGCGRGEHPTGAAAPIAPVIVPAPSAPPASSAWSAAPASTTPAAADWREVPFGQLCVTSGAVSPGADGSFIILGATFRAVSSAASDGGGRLTFEYVGSTEETRALGSGLVRHQIGLKLRAQDPCNLLYVMWRIAPVNEVVVSVKRNPGKSTSAGCGNRGYTNLSPQLQVNPPAIAPGSDHVLSARISGSRLDVVLDEALVWRGDIGVEAQQLRGPIGVRSDNVKARGRLSVEGETSGARSCRPGEVQD